MYMQRSLKYAMALREEWDHEMIFKKESYAAEGRWRRWWASRKSFPFVVKLHICECNNNKWERESLLIPEGMNMK